MDQGALELDHPSTATAAQVLMFPRALDLVGAAELPQVPFLDQALFPKQTQVTVDGSQANAGVLLGGSAIKLLRIQVCPSGLYGRKQELSLGCERSQVLCPGLAIASHSHLEV